MSYRHPNNPNLTLTYETDYYGLPLLPKHGPYIEQYLDKILQTIRAATGKHKRVTAIRFDLRIPADSVEPSSNVISKFFDSLKAKLAADQLRRDRKGLRVYSPDLRDVWIRETATSHHRHYHCCILLNGDAYHHLGSYRSSTGNVDESEGLTNMALRIRSAWASALRCDWPTSVGLVHFSFNGVYHLNVNAEGFVWHYGALFQRLSYFAKVDTKQYGDGYHSFGCSR